MSISYNRESWDKLTLVDQLQCVFAYFTGLNQLFYNRTIRLEYKDMQDLVSWYDYVLDLNRFINTYQPYMNNMTVLTLDKLMNIHKDTINFIGLHEIESLEEFNKEGLMALYKLQVLK